MGELPYPHVVHFAGNGNIAKHPFITVTAGALNDGATTGTRSSGDQFNQGSGEMTCR